MAKVGDTELRLEVSGTAEGPYYVSFVDVIDRPGRTLEINSSWWPGDPVWEGKVGDKSVAVQVRPILNGVSLAFRGVQERVYVYTEREAALVAVMQSLHKVAEKTHLKKTRQ